MSPTVAVVGAGPVGLMAACELAAAGVDTVVLDRLAEPDPRAPGMAINPTVVELLTQRGIIDDLRQEGLDVPVAFFAHFPVNPTLLPEQRAFNLAVAQAKVERRLAEHAVKLGVDLRRGHRVVGLSQDDGSVDVDVDAGTGIYRLRVGWVVGCDGADSTVRALAGIGFPGVEEPFYGIVAEFDISPALVGILGPHLYDRGLCTVGPSGPDTLRVTTGEFGVTAADPDAPVTVDELKAHIDHLAGTDVQLDRPRWASRWFCATRQADEYRRGRVFLAGDAAHLCFPLGGLALGTGIEDAVNLGWKLAAAVHGSAPRQLLDTYAAERAPAAARAATATRAQTALMHPMGRVGPLRELFAELTELGQVNEFLVRLSGGLDVRYPVTPAPHPLVGYRLAGGAVAALDGPQRVLDALAAGRGVLLELPGGGRDRPGERVDVITSTPTPLIPAAALLLRPDGRVAWAADADHDGTALRTAVGRWFGQAGQEPLKPQPPA